MSKRKAATDLEYFREQLADLLEDCDEQRKGGNPNVLTARAHLEGALTSIDKALSPAPTRGKGSAEE